EPTLDSTIRNAWHFAKHRMHVIHERVLARSCRLGLVQQMQANCTTHAPTRATRATRATWAVPVILGVAEEPVQSGLAPGKGPWHAGCSWARRRGGPRRETILTEQGRLMKHSRTQGLASITGLTLVLGACSGDGYENEDNGAPLLDSHKQEILNGQTSN